MRLLSDAIALCFLTACGGSETSSPIDGLYTFRDCYGEIERHAFILAIPLPFDQFKVFEVLANHPYFYFRVKLKSSDSSS